MERRLGLEWANLRRARKLADAKRQELQKSLAGLDSEDTSIVVSGSLARDEFTEGSDIDWTLLIDGLSDPGHYALTNKIDEIIRGIASKPVGREGAFGAMVFSHDLVHQIGGDVDTNKNTTRRLLLLLESRVVGREDAYQRVVRNILNRYLLEDRGFWRSRDITCHAFSKTILRVTGERWWSTSRTNGACGPGRVGRFET